MCQLAALLFRAHVVCLHASLDDVQRVHDQDLRHTGDGAGGELVDEGKRLGFGGHVDGRVGLSGEVVGSLSRYSKYEREDVRVRRVERVGLSQWLARSVTTQHLSDERCHGALLVFRWSAKVQRACPLSAFGAPLSPRAFSHRHNTSDPNTIYLRFLSTSMAEYGEWYRSFR